MDYGRRFSFLVVLLDFLVHSIQKPVQSFLILQLPISFVVGVLIGAAIGLLSGIVGIGGGIMLSPILFNLKAAQPKQIVVGASLFILINSISGFLGQIQKLDNLLQLEPYFYLLLAVLLGGQLGNFLNIKILKPHILAILTSILVLFVALSLGLKIF
jgi:uncharacterized membrane protein YfcA